MTLVLLPPCPTLLPGLYSWSQEIRTAAKVTSKEEPNNIWNSACGISESMKGRGLERPGRNCLQLCYSMCGLWTSNTWELVINTDSRALARTNILTIFPGDSDAQQSLRSTVRAQRDIFKSLVLAIELLRLGGNSLHSIIRSQKSWGC